MRPSVHFPTAWRRGEMTQPGLRRERSSVRDRREPDIADRGGGRRIWAESGRSMLP
jgi:hypothetical protein